MTEVWKSVVGFEGWYEVSDYGRVRSIERFGHDGRNYKSCVLASRIVANGYLCIDLYRDGVRTTRTVHSLVAEAFIGRCPAGQEVCHGPGGQQNNRPDNLRYGTRASNFADKKRDGTEQVGEKHWNSKLSDAQVDVIRDSNETNAHLAKQFNVSDSAISMIRSGKRRRQLT